ncbi:MAG: CapA family protein [Pseudobdellovibrionaceae bacterium]
MPSKSALNRILLRCAWASVAALFFSSFLASADEAPVRLVFTGDILLSRQVQREITLKNGQSPWSKMQGFFKGADWVMGNFEGTLGDSSKCSEKDPTLCFAISPAALQFPKDAGFTALGVENNHSADLGAEGRKRTREELLSVGLSAIDYEHSPGFFKSKGHVFSFIALSNVAGRDTQKVEVPSPDLRQKIRLAKSLSDWVIVNVHWGTELVDWPQPKQREMAQWLVEQGADLIIGHHPHIVQAPECIEGRPVFFSLGNHVFDQKYPETKQGLIAECRVSGNQLSCSGVATSTAANSSFPEVRNDSKKIITNCSVSKAAPLVVDGYQIRPRLAEKQFIDGEVVLEGSKPGAKHWTLVAKQLLSLAKGRLTSGKTSKDFLFTLETHTSSIDQEASPRPYVYEVTSHGLIAKWRGSALAWPLVDGKLIQQSPKGDLDYLCALHRKDSFIALNPKTKETRTAVYKWNGFGFSGVDDPTLTSHCKNAFN